MNSLVLLRMLTAEVTRGQSSSSSLPERTACWLTLPSDEIIRMVSASPGISIEKTATGRLVATATFSAIFIANVVLPIDGRPATMIRSDF